MTVSLLLWRLILSSITRRIAETVHWIELQTDFEVTNAQTKAFWRKRTWEKELLQKLKLGVIFVIGSIYHTLAGYSDWVLRNDVILVFCYLTSRFLKRPHENVVITVERCTGRNPPHCKAHFLNAMRHKDLMTSIQFKGRLSTMLKPSLPLLEKWLRADNDSIAPAGHKRISPSGASSTFSGYHTKCLVEQRHHQLGSRVRIKRGKWIHNKSWANAGSAEPIFVDDPRIG